MASSADINQNLVAENKNLRRENADKDENLVKERAENERLKESLAKATASEQTLTEQKNKLLLENNIHINSLADIDVKYQMLEAKSRAEKDQLNLQIRDLTAKVPVKPKISNHPVSKDDMLSKMIQIGIDNNLQEKMAKLNSFIDMLK